MSSLATYLRNERASMDANREAQARALSDYAKNQQVLESLGQEGGEKNKKGILGRVFGALGYLSRPGNLVRAGILEAVGKPTPELQKTAGLGQIMSILSGKTDVTGAQVNEALFPGLKVGKNDSLAQKIGKGAAGFVTDIVTDPISYVAAPASISRKAAAETLLNVANKAEFVDELARVGGRGTKLVDELVSSSPVAKTVRALEEAGDVESANKLVDSAGAAVNLADDAGRKAVAAQSAADRLSQAFYTRGRTGLMKELEALTGSRDAAMKVFRTLPEDVRGGLVLANPITGKAFTGAGGEYLRLTQGTGAALGPLAEPLNRVRQGLGVLGNPVTRSFSGQAGNVLADVKKAAWKGTAEGEEKLGPRFIDYTQTKKAAQERGIKRTQIQSMAESANKAALFAGKDFEGDQADEFREVLQSAFFTPDKAVADVAASTTKTEASDAALAAADKLRKDFAEVYEEAKRSGVDIGNIGSPYEYSPLMLTDAAYERMRRLGTASGDTNVYRMEMGRGSHIEYIPDADVAREVGFVDPSNPGVTYLNAKAVNDKLEERARVAATKAGKTADEVETLAKEARIYIEDPLLIMQKYGNYVANAAATKRFTEVLALTGTVIRDVPRVRKLLEEWNTSTFAAALKNIDPEIQKSLREYEAGLIDELQVFGIDVTPIGLIRENLVRASQARAAARAAGDAAAYDDAEMLFQRMAGNLVDYSAVAKGADKDRAEAMLDIVEKLDEQDFSVWTAIDDRAALEAKLDALSKLDRDDPAVGAAIADLTNVFGKIRSRIPPEVFEKLTKVQREAITGEGFNRLRTTLMRNEMEPGAIARTVVPMGYEALKPGTANAFANLYADSSIIEAIDRIYKGVDSTDSWQRVINTYIDPFLGAWKLAATTGRGPAFVINNVMGGMFNNWIGGVSGADHRMALAVLTKIQKQIKVLERTNPDKTFFAISRMAEDAVLKDLNKTVINGVGLGDLYKDFVRMGGFDQTQVSAATQQASRQTPTGEMAATFETFAQGKRAPRAYVEPAQSRGEELFRKGLDKTTNNAYMAAMTDLSQSSEMYLRFSAFIDGFRRYGDPDAAMGKVKMLHFDYSDLGPGEEWMRRIVPFYTWSRNNIPLQFRTILLQPGKIQKAVKAQQAIGGVFESENDDSWLNSVMPEWVSEKGGVVSMLGQGANKLALIPNLPYTNVEEITSGTKLLGQLGPGLQGTAEILSGRNLQTGAPIDKPLFDTIASNVTPFYTTGKNVLTAAGVPIPGEEDKQLQRALALSGIPALGGFQVSGITPRTTTGELRNRSRRQSARIEEAASALGVDPSWIRRALDKGIEPQTIAMLIQSGAGRTRESLGLPAKEERLSDARRQRALDAIASMGNG